MKKIVGKIGFIAFFGSLVVLLNMMSTMEVAAQVFVGRRHYRPIVVAPCPPRVVVVPHRLVYVVQPPVYVTPAPVVIVKKPYRRWRRW